VCIIEAEPYDWFKGNVGNLTGKVIDASGAVRYTIQGNWNDSISVQKTKGNEPPRLVWKKIAPPAHSKEQYYFTGFTTTLNEIEPGQKEFLPPTDSRLRPDQQLYEVGKTEEAQAEKDRLEDKQRATRRLMEAGGEEHQPKWFKKVMDPDVGQESWTSNGQYFLAREKHDWSACPDIY